MSSIYIFKTSELQFWSLCLCIYWFSMKLVWLSHFHFMQFKFISRKDILGIHKTLLFALISVVARGNQKLLWRLWGILTGDGRCHDDKCSVHGDILLPGYWRMSSQQRSYTGLTVFVYKRECLYMLVLFKTAEAYQISLGLTKSYSFISNKVKQYNFYFMDQKRAPLDKKGIELF